MTHGADGRTAAKWRTQRRTVPAQAVSQGPPRFGLDPFWVLTGLLLAVAVAVAAQLPWSGDLGLHAATIERLRTDVTHPGHPLVDASDPSPYYSPYTVALALVAKALNLSGLAVLAWVGPLNVLLVALGLRAFVRTLTRHRLAPSFALVLVLVLWGPKPRVFSGVYSLWSLLPTMSYPSTAALALTLVFWAALARALAQSLNWPNAVGLGVLAAIIALTHPVTFVTAAVGAASIVVASAPSRAAWMRLAASSSVAVAVLLTWPYYSIFDLRASDALSRVHLVHYDRPWLFYGLALVALPALWQRYQRQRRDPLVLLFLAASAIVGLGWLTGKYEYGRLWSAALLAAQLALAAESTELLGQPGSRRRPISRPVAAWLALTALSIVAGTISQGGHLVQALPRAWLPANPFLQRLHGTWPDYSWLSQYVHVGEVVVTDDYYALRTLPGYGAYTVAPAWPDPSLSDETQRRADLAEIIAATTDLGTRGSLMAKYHVSWVLEMPGRWSISAGSTPVATGPTGQRLYRLTAVP